MFCSEEHCEFVLVTLERLCTVAVRVANVTQRKDIFLPRPSHRHPPLRKHSTKTTTTKQPPSLGTAASAPLLSPFLPHHHPTPLRQESQVQASEKGAFDVEAAARTGKREILGLFVTQRRGDGSILRCRLHPAFCSSSRGAQWVGGGGECGPSSPSQQAVYATFSMIRHLHTGRRIYLIYPNMQQAEEMYRDACGDNFSDYLLYFYYLFIDFCFNLI